MQKFLLELFASKYKLYLSTEEEFKKELNLDNYIKREDNLKKDNDSKNKNEVENE